MNTKCSFEFEGASNLSNWLLWKNTVKYEPIPLTMRGKLWLLALNEIQILVFSCCPTCCQAGHEIWIQKFGSSRYKTSLCVLKLPMGTWHAMYILKRGLASNLDIIYAEESSTATSFRLDTFLWGGDFAQN